MLQIMTNLVEEAIPSFAVSLLQKLANKTGLAWGPTATRLFWFQSPAIHIFLFVVMNFFALTFLYQRSKGFRGITISRIAAVSPKCSFKCPLNTLAGVVLLGCFGAQVYFKSMRAQPLIQLGWLLMPCHLMTLSWAYVLLRQSALKYAENCFITTMLIDFAWAPLGAVLFPDQSDHQFSAEAFLFTFQHWMLLLLPIYAAARYHSVGVDRVHTYYIACNAILLYFGFYTIFSILTGLNLGYMLYPPPLGNFCSSTYHPWYRPVLTVILILSSLVANVVLRQIGASIRLLTRNFGKEKVKMN